MFSFFSPYRHQFVRLGACVPRVAVAEPRLNAAAIEALLAAGDAARVALMVFPELGLSAYAIDDLLFQDALLDTVEAESAGWSTSAASSSRSLSWARRCGRAVISTIAGS